MRSGQSENQSDVSEISFQGKTGEPTRLLCPVAPMVKPMSRVPMGFLVAPVRTGKRQQPLHKLGQLGIFKDAKLCKDRKAMIRNQMEQKLKKH